MAGPRFCPRCPNSTLISDPFGGASLVCPLCQHTEAAATPATPANAGTGDWWNSGTAVTDSPPPTPALSPALPEPPSDPFPLRNDSGSRWALVGLVGLALLCFAIPVLIFAFSARPTPETGPTPVAVVTPTVVPTPLIPPSPMLPMPEEPVARPLPVVNPDERPQPQPEKKEPMPGLPELPPVPEKPAIVEKKPEPGPNPVPMTEPQPQRKVVGRLQKYSEADLRRLLDDIPEIGLERVPGSSKFLVERARALTLRQLPYTGPLANLPANRTDLVGLPMRMGKDCHLGKEEADNLHALSRKLRSSFEQAMQDPTTGRFAVVAGTVPADPRIDSDRLESVLGRNKDWRTADAVPTMLQMMQAENKPVRKVLIDRLAEIPDRRATTALAMRAVTDLSPDLREAALQALKGRSPEDFRPILLAALRYPFQPVAEHAAEALVALNDRDSIPTLVGMIDLSPSQQPLKVGNSNQFVIRELVRINHLGNCVLCHQPSFDRNDMVRGAVPTMGVAIPGPASTPAYYERDQGDFVRADITYLRQDFSVMQPVQRPNNWPNFQRYDYLVRLRKPTANEMATLNPTNPEKASKNPSRDAVLFALKELTSKDFGITRKDWESGLAIEFKETPKTDELVRTAGRDWRQFVTTMLPEIKGGEK